MAAGLRRAVDQRRVMAVDAERDAFVGDTVRAHAVERRHHAALALQERIGEADEAAGSARRCRRPGAAPARSPSPAPAD